MNVEVAPPALGDKPKEIVEGYLRATSNYQPNYSVARQFLDSDGSGEVEPGARCVDLSRFSDRVSGQHGQFRWGTSSALLRPTAPTCARDRQLAWNFGYSKRTASGGSTTPPPGLMVAEFSFNSFYQTYDLYFCREWQVAGPGPHLSARR